MSRYVRTKDGVMTVKRFILSKLRERLGPNPTIWEDKGKYCYTIEFGVSSGNGNACSRFETHHKTEKEALQMFENMLLKKADTIEELCDEFVCTGGKGRNSFLSPEYKNFDEEGYPTDTYEEGILNAIRRGVNYINYVWYGAIWTDKGLIYVAKMNKKGELELL